MQIVTKEYQEAIRNDVRRLRGYVEIIYEDKKIDKYKEIITPQAERISLPKELIDSQFKVLKYASLEENYTLLDGTFLLPNYNLKGIDAGYISKNTFEEIKDPTIKIEFNEDNFVKTKGISVFFKDNIAQNFELSIINSENYEILITENNNRNESYNFFFDQEIIIKSFSLKINKMEYSNRRIRIPEISFGIVQIYEGNSLISFETIDEIDLLLTSTPIGECKVNINNYDHLFDPLNPKGITKYLTNNTIIKPYLGVLTSNMAEEYKALGTYYLKDWSSSSDGNVILNGQNLMYILSTLSLKSDGRLLYNNGEEWEGWEFNKYLNNLYDYKFRLNILSINNKNLKKTDLLSLLQANLSFQNRLTSPKKLFISKDDEIVFDEINFNNISKLSKSDLLEEANIETKNTIKEVVIKTINNKVEYSNAKKDVLNIKYKLTSKEEWQWFNFNKRIYRNNIGSSEFNFESTTNAKAELIDYNDYICYIKFTGNEGDDVTIHFETNVYENPTSYNLVISNDNKMGDSLNIDYTDYFITTNDQLKENGKYLLEMDKKYKITANYIGDPINEVGDVMDIETSFGNKRIIITKHRLKFDGGLSGSIEGVGN